MKVDLHNHSYYSDGVFSPTEVVRLADEAGCDLFALTDHDTTDGLNEARQTADKLSVDLVSGVEISALWRNMTIHIVGLGIDINNDVLQKGLNYNQGLRKERAEKISVEYQDVKGNIHQMEAEEMMSICLQHEIDHLNGILFIDHLPVLKQKMVKKKLTKLAMANA